MTYASSQYQKQSGSYLSPREIEVMTFRHVNALLTQARTHAEKTEALAANLKLWSLLCLSVERVDCPLPTTLRDDIIKLGAWSMRYTNSAFNASRDLKPLIDINTDMIEGLCTSHVASHSVSYPPAHSNAQRSDATASLALSG